MTCSDVPSLRTAEACLASAMAAFPSNAPRFAMLQFGFDGFQRVNDQFGRQIGDAVLLEGEKRLVGSIREHEMVVRLATDGFAVLLHSVGTVIRAGKVADRLNAILQQPYVVEDLVLRLTASVGMALSPEDGTNAELLLRRAGRALRCAKDVGSGTVQFFESAMEEPRRKRAAGEPQLADIVSGAAGYVA